MDILHMGDTWRSSEQFASKRVVRELPAAAGHTSYTLTRVNRSISSCVALDNSLCDNPSGSRSRSPQSTAGHTTLFTFVEW